MQSTDEPTPGPRDYLILESSVPSNENLERDIAEVLTRP